MRDFIAGLRDFRQDVERFGETYTRLSPFQLFLASIGHILTFNCLYHIVSSNGSENCYEPNDFTQHIIAYLGLCGDAFYVMSAELCHFGNPATSFACEMVMFIPRLFTLFGYMIFLLFLTPVCVFAKIIEGLFRPIELLAW